MGGHITTSYIVSFDISEPGGDLAVCIVGSQDKGKMTIVNAFQGQKAVDIYNILTKKESVKENEK